MNLYLIRFQRYIIGYMFITTTLSVCVILPLNFQGNSINKISKNLAQFNRIFFFTGNAGPFSLFNIKIKIEIIFRRSTGKYNRLRSYNPQQPGSSFPFPLGSYYHRIVIELSNFLHFLLVFNSLFE